MRILFFTRLYYPHIGGIEKHLEKVCEVLVTRGYNVTIVTTNYSEDLPDEESYKGVRIIRFQQPDIKFLGLIYTWFWIFKNLNLIRNADKLHIHDVFNWYWPFKLLFPKKPVYLTIHGRWGEYPIPLKDTIQKKLSARFSDGILAVGKYIPKNYGLTADIVSYGATEVPRKAIKKGNNRIVYVGRMDKDIALSKAFEVFEKIEGYKIDFCGNGDLKNKAKKYGKVHGFTDPNPFYRKAKYCFASGYLTILEALANKCLVFTLYEHKLQKDYYLLTPFKDFIITSDDPEVIHKKFLDLSQNLERSEELINKGYAWAKNQTWEKMVENYETLWNKA